MRLTTLKGRSGEQGARNLDSALNKRLRLDDQFNSFVAVVTIAAGQERAVTNHLKDAGGRHIVPGEWHVVDAAGAATGSLTRGPTAWTKHHLYFKNTSSDDGQFKIRFYERPQTPDDATTLPVAVP